MGVSIRFDRITLSVSTHYLFACVVVSNLGLSTVLVSSLQVCMTLGRVLVVDATIVCFGRETSFADRFAI